MRLPLIDIRVQAPLRNLSIRLQDPQWVSLRHVNTLNLDLISHHLAMNTILRRTIQLLLALNLKALLSKLKQST